MAASKISDSELAMFAAMAHSKGMSVDAFADALKDCTDPQSLTKNSTIPAIASNSMYIQNVSSRAGLSRQEPWIDWSRSHITPAQFQAVNPASGSWWQSMPAPGGTNMFDPRSFASHQYDEFFPPDLNLEASATQPFHSANSGLNAHTVPAPDSALSTTQQFMMAHQPINPLDEAFADWTSINYSPPPHPDQSFLMHGNIEGELKSGSPQGQSTIRMQSNTEPVGNDNSSSLEWPHQAETRNKRAQLPLVSWNIYSEHHQDPAPHFSDGGVGINGLLATQDATRPQLSPALARDNSTKTTSSISSDRSWIITTPQSEQDVAHGSRSSSGSRDSLKRGRDICSTELNQYDSENQKYRRQGSKKTPAASIKPKPPGTDSGVMRQWTSSILPNQETKNSTVRKRALITCHRCRKQKQKCEPNPVDIYGPCLTCLAAVPTMSNLPCMRIKVTNSISLYREQTAPNSIWTKRWSDFRIQNITEWASSTIRTIYVTQGMGDSGYELEVKQFIPIEGDLMEKFWTNNGERRAVQVPPFAIVDLEKAAKSRLQFVNDNVGTYVAHCTHSSDTLIRTTYERAIRHAKEAPREDERRLLRDTLYLFVATRMSSMTEWLCGEDHLDMRPVDDVTSPYFGHTPIPPVMSAQFQIIAYSKILRPVKTSIVKQLTSLGSAAETRRSWFTLYLTHFILLHSVALVTRRAEEYARQINLKTRFADPQSITDYHNGALVLLADFHYSNKRQLPFSIAEGSDNLQDLADIAELTLDQVLFIKNTAILVRQKRGMMMEIREQKQFADDYYFVSQLYDEKWIPSAIA